MVLSLNLSSSLWLWRVESRSFIKSTKNLNVLKPRWKLEDWFSSFAVFCTHRKTWKEVCLIPVQMKWRVIWAGYKTSLLKATWVNVFKVNRRKTCWQWPQQYQISYNVPQVGFQPWILRQEDSRFKDLLSSLLHSCLNLHYLFKKILIWFLFKMLSERPRQKDLPWIPPSSHGFGLKRPFYHKERFCGKRFEKTLLWLTVIWKKIFFLSFLSFVQASSKNLHVNRFYFYDCGSLV